METVSVEQIDADRKKIRTKLCTRLVSFLTFTFQIYNLNKAPFFLRRSVFSKIHGAENRFRIDFSYTANRISLYIPLEWNMKLTGTGTRASVALYLTPCRFRRQRT
jgi:hypothetical protein